MRYVQPNTTFPYPSHNLDPRIKQTDPKKFLLPYARAAWCDTHVGSAKGIFASNGGDYEKYRMYALGKQPNTPYKTWLGVDSATNNTWLSVDWSIRPIISPYRDKTISRLMEMERSIVATPVDMLAKAEQAGLYADMKAKMVLRQLMQQQNPEMAAHPLIAQQAGEPMDMEELEMRIELGEQFNRSRDAEMAIALGLHENNYRQFRRAIYEDLFDFGVAGYKEWLGDDNKPKFRRVNPECVVTNYVRSGDFRSWGENPELIHAGEVIDVSLVDLATRYNEKGERLFDDQTLQEFAGTIAGKWGNPAAIGAVGGGSRAYDKFKCKVLDLELFSYDELTYKDRLTREGNPVFRREDYRRGQDDNGKYRRKCIQVVYKVKWIVGTDHCYDFGLATDMKRSQDPRQKAYTSLSYKFYAYNFYEMKAQGFMERLVPYLDDYQLTMLKIQNFKNRAVPSGWWIDLDALENVALNKGGSNMQPRELLQMFFETGVLMGRGKGADGTPQGPNWKPVIPIENTAASELAMFYQDLLSIISQIERITSYNDITMGQPNAKTLVPGYEVAEQSTNHGLYPLRFAEKELSLLLAADVLCRMQQGIRKGGVSGYAQALNSNTLQFIAVSPDIATRQYGITLDEKTTDDQRAWLFQQMQQDIANGFLDSSDAVMLVNTMNVKQAQLIWAYRVKKAKEKQQQYELEKIKANNEGNALATQAAEQAKQQTLQLEAQIRLQELQMQLQADIQKKKLELEAEAPFKMRELEMKYRMAAEKNLTDIEITEKTNETTLAEQELANEGALEKQRIANKKPQPKSTNK